MSETGTTVEATEGIIGGDVLSVRTADDIPLELGVLDALEEGLVLGDEDEYVPFGLFAQDGNLIVSLDEDGAGEVFEIVAVKDGGLEFELLDRYKEYVNGVADAIDDAPDAETLEEILNAEADEVELLESVLTAPAMLTDEARAMAICNAAGLNLDDREMAYVVAGIGALTDEVIEEVEDSTVACFDEALRAELLSQGLLTEDKLDGFVAAVMLKAREPEIAVETVEQVAAAS